MQQYADLELSLIERDPDTKRYRLVVRYNDPQSVADIGAEADVKLDHAALIMLTYTHKSRIEYGKALFNTFFADPAIRDVYTRARTFSEQADAVLRVRLHCEPAAMPIHNLWWELLRDDQNRSLVTSERVLFSRYLSGSEMVMPQLRGLRQPQVFAALSNPTNVEELGFASIESDLEVQRLAKALDTFEWKSLPDKAPATVQQLIDGLRTNASDVLYLVAHGRIGDDDPEILLQNDDGSGAFVSAREFGARISELQRRPTLVILASCQSAGDGFHQRDTDALLSLGPWLVRYAGVAAVVAMNGKVTMDTVAAFMPAFLRELQNDGQPDRAMAVARGVVRERDDAWIPVLYTRMRRQAIWYAPELILADAQANRDQRWSALVDNIFNQACVPILGPDLAEPLIDLRRRSAITLAEQDQFPLAPPIRADLPRIVQHVRQRQDWATAISQMLKTMIKVLRDQLGRDVAAKISLRRNEQLAELDTLLSARREALRTPNEPDPYTVLANLPITCYVTADYSSLLESALREKAREPLICLSPWNQEVINAQRHLPCRLTNGRYVPDEQYVPSEQEPLIFYAFGHLDFPESLVLAEDDFFQYLIALTQHQDKLFKDVKTALVRHSQMYLGFRPDDWYFRTLFRAIRSLPGSESNRQRARNAAQIPPDEHEVFDLEGTRDYFKRYFGADNIDVYWGSAAEFLADLQQRIDQS